MARWASHRHGGIGEWSIGSATADRDWDRFARWVSRDGGVGNEMGLSCVVAASRCEQWQDGSLSPLSFSLYYSLISKSVSPLTCSSSFFIRFSVWFWTSGFTFFFFFF